MHGLKVLLGITALLGSLALVPKANAQVTVDIGVPPVCSYGYYNYAPYACAPVGFYGPGYFYSESSWAWAHGLAGAITTAGVAIASALLVVEGITAEVVLRPIVDVPAAHR